MLSFVVVFGAPPSVRLTASCLALGHPQISAKSFPCHTYQKCARNSFICHTYKNKGLKVLCLPHLRKTPRGWLLSVNQLPPLNFPFAPSTLNPRMSLFPTSPTPAEQEASLALQPLAERMRPRTLDEFIGQEKLLGPSKPLRVQIEADNLGSMLFWGPPGCGKTTLARVIARLTKSEFISFSAVLSGIKEIKEVMAASEYKSKSGRRTIVFVDEVHRFNKAQQDAFLPYVEAGHITINRATT